MQTRIEIAQNLQKRDRSYRPLFEKYAIQLRRKYNCVLSEIGIMDEIPACFEFPTNRTVEIIQ